jgi:hypothetical protein
MLHDRLPCNSYTPRRSREGQIRVDVPSDDRRAINVPLATVANRSIVVSYGQRHQQVKRCNRLEVCSLQARGKAQLALAWEASQMGARHQKPSGSAPFTILPRAVRAAEDFGHDQVAHFQRPRAAHRAGEAPAPLPEWNESWER